MRVPASLTRREPLLRRGAILAGVAILIGCFVQVLLKAQDGDFALHRESGRRFLAGEFIYANGHDFPYPPFFAMLWAPTALLPMGAAKIVFYPFAVIFLVALVWLLQRLVTGSFSLSHTQLFWITVLALLLDLQYFIHDQAVFGLNTALVLLSWLGIYWWRKGRDLPGGISLGAAIALKCTPAIFLGYFLWKRQWRMASCTVAAALLFTVSPLLWQGPALWKTHMENWTRTALAGVSGTGFQEHEDFRDKNMALRPVLLRYFVHLPEIGGPEDPRPLRFLNLSPALARVLVNSILAALVILFLWWSRRSIVARDDVRLLWECAALGILMVLFSPITWGQHCVALLPFCFLVAATLVVRAQMPRWVMIILAIYILFCCLVGRDLIGKKLGVALVSYHLTTFCILSLFAIALAGPALSTDGAGSNQKNG